VGPSLESIGASAPPDYLLDSLLEPAKAVKENYHSMVVVTTDGLIITGIKVRQTDQELVLRDVNDRERAIPLASIEEQKTGGSLMPSGLVDPLTRSELVDLVRFLSELGKIGPYSVGKDCVFRRWEVLEADGKAYTELRRWGLQSAANPNPALTWSPTYTKVSGELPLSELPLIRLDALPGSGAEVGATGLVRAQVSVSTPGAIKLVWNTAKGLRIWIDGTPAEPKENAVVLDVSSGLHTVTLAVEKSLRQEPLRCTLEDVPGSPARAQVVLGK
jgi:putative heme-binding domain-containing protein